MLNSHANYIQDAVPWAFPRNFRAPSQKSSRRQRLLSFLRGAAPDRSPAAAAGSRSGDRGSGSSARQLPAGGPAAPVIGSAVTGSAAAGSTGGVVFSELGSPFGADLQQPPVASAAAPAAGAGAAPQPQPEVQAWGGQSEAASLLAAGSSSNALPDFAVQHCCLIGGGGGGSAPTQSAAQHLYSETDAERPPPQQQQQRPPVEGLSVSEGTATTPLPPWPSRGILGNLHGGGGGGSGDAGDGSHSNNGPQPDCTSLGGASSAGGGIQPVSPLPAAQGSLSADASGEAPRTVAASAARRAGCAIVFVARQLLCRQSMLKLRRNWHCEFAKPKMRTAGHTSIDMQPLEARSMQPADNGPRNSEVAAAAAAVLASQPGDIEEGRLGAGGMMATPANGKRRGFRGWAVGEQHELPHGRLHMWQTTRGWQRFTSSAGVCGH